MFHIGQQVVCVNDHEYHIPFRAPGMDGLTKGCVYTIRELCICDYDNSLGVKVEEILREPDTAYWAHRFRPVRTTSIEIFQRLLAPTPETELV